MYLDQQGFNVSQNDEVAYLLPGAYHFENGLDIGGVLMGGLVPGDEGVVLVVPQDEDLAANNAVGILLNVGSDGCTEADCRPLAARDFEDVPMVTPEGLILTIEVPRDEQCFSGTEPLNVKKCTTANSTISMPGNGKMHVAGVIYAPSDNVGIFGDNSDQTGEIGQIVAWTIRYSGGAKLNQDYPDPEKNGILRLDPACTGLETCNDP